MRNLNGTNMSGYTYVKARLRHGSGEWFPLMLRQPLRCKHGADPEDERLSEICPRCAECWSWDFDLAMHSTAAGRRLAEELGLDPLTADTDLRYRDGYEPRPAS